MWQITAIVSRGIGQTQGFYKPGTFRCLLGGAAIHIYRVEAGGSVYLGRYGEIELPADFPALEFPSGADQLAVIPG